MKRILSYMMFGLAAAAVPAVLAGCPIYSDNGNQPVCLDNGSCYSCPGNAYSSSCTGYACSTDNDCPNGYSCNGYGSCIPSPIDASVTSTGTSCAEPTDCQAGENCGSDDTCHAGDCSNSGCPTGYQCKLSSGTLSCVSTSGGGGDAMTSSPDGGADAATDGPVAPKVACHNDTECTRAGDKCLDGACVAQADQCSDTTQCPNAEQCVAGVCTPSCATSACPSGYSCDANMVCTGNPTPCGAAADAGTCGTGTTCVDERCVPDCSPTLTCATGLVCVGGGCIPDQKAQFVCAQEGVMDSCASGSLCLHHSCYIGCDADAGSTACKSADKFNVCKQVLTSSGTYSVCGSSSNLGTDCDPTLAKNCTAGKVCIDGFCK